MRSPLPDPRLAGVVDEVRPAVANRRADLPIWMIAVASVLGAVVLFMVLDGLRRESAVPAVRPGVADVLPVPTALSPLFLGPEFVGPPSPPPSPSMLATQPDVAVATSLEQTPSAPTLPSPMPTYPPFPPIDRAPAPIYSPPPPQAMPSPSASGAQALVVDMARSGRSTDGRPINETGIQNGRGEAGRTDEGSGEVGRAARLRRRSTTIPQGTLIPTVLETAIDATQPVSVRAMVSRDVTGFDGSQVLIARGSRVFGVYQANLTPGQDRAFVRWTRLVRPDGVTISLDSPAVDETGRTGIPGNVDTRFLQRFGSAVLQTTLNLGSGLAGRSIAGGGSTIVAVPGSGQGGNSSVAATQTQPRLRVEAGVTVMVLLLEDLQLPADGQR